MTRITASLLALGLAASIGTASAQSSGYGSYGQYGNTYGQSQYDQYGQPLRTYQQGAYGQSGSYGQPAADRYGNVDGAYYDYATVLRVDPVYGAQNGYGYPTSDARRCTTRRDTYASDGSRYDPNGYSQNGYPVDGYGRTTYGANSAYGNGYGGSTAGRTVATVIGGVLGAALGSQVGGGSARYATSAIGTMVGGIAGQKVYESAQRNRYPRTGIVEVCDPVQVDQNGYPTSYGQNANGYGQGGYNGQVYNGQGYNQGYGRTGYNGNAAVRAYDVTYSYAGRTYTTRTDYNPGSRMRVRVAVAPQ